MILREFFKSKKIISEGGNLSSQSPGWKGAQDVAADEIDLKVHNRSFMVGLLDKLLHDIDNAFKATYKKSLWSKELLQNKQFLGGSSLHFFNTKGISDEEFVKHKPKVGDIDTQTNKELEPEIEQFLNTITGKKVGDAVFLGFSRGNEQLNGLFQFEDPPIKIQIDFEFGRYAPETNAPDNWYKFSHSSAWNDVQAGIKGVMHKYLYRALAKAGPTTKYVAKLEGRGKARAITISGPITDANFSFAVASVGGGGVRAKYKPYIDPETGQEKIIDSIPVMEPVNPADSEYIQNLSQQFELFFNHQPETGDLQLQQSFLGTLDLINKYLDDAAKQNAFKEFLTIVFEPGGQMITANDPARDREIKFAAIDSMIEKLGLGSMRAQSVQMAKDYEQDYHDLEAFKQSNPNEKQPRAAMNKLKKATPVTEAGEVKAQLRKNMPHLRDLKSIDFLDLLDEIHDGNGTFKLENIPLNVKVDGFGGRFGKDAGGKPFMATSNTSPRYAAGFVKYHQDKGTNDPEILGRAKLFDQLFDEMMNAIKLVDNEFGTKFLIDKQVTCEVLFLPFATETPEGKLKFVGIQYDKLPEGVQLALVPFRVVNATSGDDLADAQEIVSKLTSIGQQGSIMFINNSLTQKEGLDVTALVPPLENLEQFKSMLSDPSAGSLKRKQEVAAALEPVKLALEKAISEDPNILGKELLGKDYEGIVINSRLGPIKVTSQTQRDVITVKNAAKANARTERPRENNNKTAVVAIGSFIGHKGHEELLNYTIKKAKLVGGDPYLFIGNAEGKDDPIPPAVKVQTWHKLYPELANNISTVQDGGQLIQKIKHELINPLPGKPPRYDNIIIMVGEDRAGMNMPTALMKAVNKFQGYEHVKASLEVTPRGTGISGTALRNSLKNDPPEKALATWSNAFDVNKLGVDWITHLMDITRTGMGIQKLQQPPPQPQQEPLVEQRLFNALVRPLKESTSIESTLRAIINDIGEPITSVYATMKFQAKKYMENHGELGRGFRMVAAGVGGRWVQNMYVGRLHNELYALCKYNTRRTVDLKDFLRGEETDGELEMKRSFSNIANNLPSILSKLGEQLNAPQLTKNAQRWMHNKADYERYLMDLEMDGDDAPDDEPVIKPPKSNVVGQQNAQVDKIVNDILSKIPKNIAGEIRNAIARSPNKLSALKQELDKHHLNMAEDTTANMRLWFASQDQNLPFRAKTSPSPRNYDYPKDIDDILKKIKNREGLSPHEFEYLKRWKSRQGVAEGSGRMKTYNDGIEDSIDLLKTLSGNSIEYIIDRLQDYQYADGLIQKAKNGSKTYNDGIEDSIDLLKTLSGNSIEYIIDRLQDYQYADEQGELRGKLKTSDEQGVAEGSLEELANTSLKVKEPKNFVNTNDRKQVVYKVMKFKSGKDTYLINFTVKGAPAFGKKSNWNAVNVSFGVREEQDDYSFGDEINTDLTAKNKNQFLIYSTVINAVRKFITEYNTEIDEIIMQGAGERQAVMYQRFFQSAGKYFPGWHHDGKHSLVRDVPRQTGKKVKEQGVAEGLDEAVGGNYLYHSTQDANTAKQILSSGYLLGNSGGKQPASNAQTTLPTVSFGRSIGYQTTGANVERDYQVVFVFDRTSIETRYKTLGTSQSQTVRGLANPIDTEWGRKVAKLGKVWGLDANADGKVDYKEIGNASKSTAPNMVKQGVSTQLNAPKAGGEFEEIVPTKTGKIPLQGLLVGFYLVPGKAASKDPELLNDPRRLDMPRPNQFVKANQAQGVAEAYPNQQAARYNSNGTTYRGSYNKMPTLDPNDPVHHADRYGSEHDKPYEMDVDKEDLKRAIAKGMLDLSDNAKRVLELRFWDNLTLEEVAAELGVSRERIRQIEAKALRQLKHPSRSDRLRPFAQVAEAPKSAAVRLGNAIQRVQGKTAASQARSVIPSNIPKPEPKKDEKKVDEKHQRLDPSCWTGYKKQGTKMKGDTRVNNCVPKENTNDDDSVISHMAKNLTGSGSPIAKIRHKRDTEREKRGSISYGYRQDPNLKTTHKQVPFSEDIENIMDILINKIIVNEAISNN